MCQRVYYSLIINTWSPDWIELWTEKVLCRHRDTTCRLISTYSGRPGRKVLFFRLLQYFHLTRTFSLDFSQNFRYIQQNSIQLDTSQNWQYLVLCIKIVSNLNSHCTEQPATLITLGRATVAEWQYSAGVTSWRELPTTGEMSAWVPPSHSVLAAECLPSARGLTVSTCFVRRRPPPSSGASAPRWWSTQCWTRSTAWRRWTPGCLASTVSSSGPAWAGTSPCWAGSPWCWRRSWISIFQSSSTVTVCGTWWTSPAPWLATGGPSSRPTPSSWPTSTTRSVGRPTPPGSRRTRCARTSPWRWGRSSWWARARWTGSPAVTCPSPVRLRDLPGGVTARATSWRGSWLSSYTGLCAPPPPQSPPGQSPARPSPAGAWQWRPASPTLPAAGRGQEREEDSLRGASSPQPGPHVTWWGAPRCRPSPGTAGPSQPSTSLRTLELSSRGYTRATHTYSIH